MLGGHLGVLALLRFGWPGLVVGAAALAVTYVRWGHPFELLVGTGLFVWLRIYLDRFAAGRAERGYGSVLLAATAYWLLLGFRLEVAFFRLARGTAVITKDAEWYFMATLPLVGAATDAGGWGGRLAEWTATYVHGVKAAHPGLKLDERRPPHA